MVIETVYIVYFFSSLCSRSIFSNNGALEYSLSVFDSIYYIKNTKIYSYMSVYNRVYILLF